MKKLSYLIEDYLIEANEEALIDSIIREYDADKAFDSLLLMESEILNELTSSEKRKMKEDEIARRKKAGTWKELNPEEKAKKEKETKELIKKYKEKFRTSNIKRKQIDKSEQKLKKGLEPTEPKTTMVPVKNPEPIPKIKEKPPVVATEPITKPPPVGKPPESAQNPNLVANIRSKFNKYKTTLLNRMRELKKDFVESPPGSVRAAIGDKIEEVKTQFKNLDLKGKAAGLLNSASGSKILAGALRFGPQIGAGMLAGLAIAGAFKLFKNMYNKGGQICASSLNKKACLAQQKLDAAEKTRVALQRAYSAAGRTEHPEKGQVRLQKQIKKWDEKIKDLQGKVIKAGG